MIIIFTKDYETAAGFIRHYHLKKDMKEFVFQIFRSSEAELVVTGDGAVRAAMAAGYFMAGRKAQEDDVFLCVEKGRLRLFAEIAGNEGGRFYYPDMCPVHGFDEDSSSSAMMAAWYETLSCFAKQHQLVFAAADDDDIPRLCGFVDDFGQWYSKSRPFHHVYVERRVMQEAEACRIMSRLNGSRLVAVNHYKDIFNRKNQSTELQKRSPALIIARKDGQLIYNGSQECQSFGNDNFYYTSSIMNCTFDCEYCYLQGMYPSADVVVFTNLEEIFDEVDELLKRQEVYLCISYDTDIMALEWLTGYCSRWIEYAAGRAGLTVELRTKAVVPDGLVEYFSQRACENIIFAFTLTPNSVQSAYEHKTPPLLLRIEEIVRFVKAGLKVRVCFDPVLVLPGSSAEYDELLRELFDTVEPEQLSDVSLGEFRVPSDYLKRMRKKRSSSALLKYPFATEGKSCCCGDEGRRLVDHIEAELKKYLPEDKIFRWR